MMWKSMLNLLVTCMVLRDNPEGGGGGAAAEPAEPAAAEQDNSLGADNTPGRPDDMTQSEWDNLLPGEQAAYRITDEAIEAQDTGELTEDELDDVLEDEGKDDDKGTETPAEKPAVTDEAPAATTDEKPVGTDANVVIPTDEDLIAYRPTVSDSEVPLPDTIPDELQTKLSAIDTKADELDAKFEEGELTRAQLRAAERELDKERQAVNREILQSQIQQRDIAKEELVWQKEQKAFYNGRPEYKNNKAMEGALISVVNGLLADPANANKTGVQILVMGDREVRKTFNLPAPGKNQAAASEQKGSTQTPKPKAPAAPLPKTPNLSNIPAAGEHDADPFAHIDAIKDPFAKEQAIAAMSEAQQNAYLNGVRR